MIRKFLSKAFTTLLDIFFPTYCCNCHQLGEFLCPNCYDQIEYLSLPVKLPLEHSFLDQVIAATALRPPISQLIYAMKYRNVRDIGKYCAEFLYNTTNIPDADIITEVPLHRKRRAQRGFNQAEEIAQHLAKLAGIPYQNLLIRTQHRAAQATLKKEQRLTHLQNIFSLAPSAGKLPPRILLIDDVVTTGTTLNECAKILKQNGAQQVIALVVAHGK